MMAVERLGLVTIGQSPRVDIVPELRGMLSKDVEIIERGALDGFSPEEIEREFAPKSDEEVLVTRLRDGREVIVGKSSIIPELQRQIDLLNAEGPDLIVLLCSGEFGGLRSRAPLLLPHKLVEGVLSSLVIEGSLAFLAPSARQLGHIERRFAELGFDAVGFEASPYTGGADALVREAALKINGLRGIDLIVMTCFGYSAQMKRLVQEITAKPVIAVRTLLGQALRELL